MTTFCLFNSKILPGYHMLDMVVLVLLHNPTYKKYEESNIYLHSNTDAIDVKDY